jgi:hypothetical protein
LQLNAGTAGTNQELAMKTQSEIQSKNLARNVVKNRRTFMMQAVVGLSAVGGSVWVQAQPMLAETDTQAAALGYKADATKVDKAKQAKYAAGQICGNCVLFQGAATAAAGGCPLFAGKQVAGKGWCNAWAKKG